MIEQQYEDLERAADGDPLAAQRLHKVPKATVVADRRLAGLLAIALDQDAGTLAVRRVAAAIAATRPSARRRSVGNVRRRISTKPRRWRPMPSEARVGSALLAATLLIAVTAWWWSSERTLAAGDQWQGSGRALLADGSQLDLDQGLLTVEADSTLRLDRGSLTVAAKSQPASAPLRIRTNVATVTVVGTRFRVTVDTDTRVTVDEGVVEVSAGNDRLLVHPRHSATIRDDAWPAMVPMELTREVALMRDFAPKEGQPPLHWHGRVSPCPSGRSGDAIHGVNYSERYHVFGVAYDNWDHPDDTIRMADGMRIQGWLWCDGPLTDLTLQSGDSDRYLNFTLPLTVPLRTWVRLDIPLALLKDENGGSPKPGCRMADLQLLSFHQADGQVLVLDQARLIIPKEISP